MGIDIFSIIFPVISVGALAVIFGAILGFSSKKYAVDSDPRVEKIRTVLLGANCGACGCAGCGAFAEAVASGHATYKDCSPGGNSTALQIAEIMGIDASLSAKKVAFVRCAGTCDKAKNDYIYDGLESCMAASMLATGGSKSCSYGCLGLASCQQACPFHAIEMVDGIAVIDPEKCASCEKCISTCPKNLIEMVPDIKKVRVACHSKDKGKEVKSNCAVGCIGCKICQKNCKFDAITVEDNLALIDYEKCTLCMECVQKCPTKAIIG